MTNETIMEENVEESENIITNGTTEEKAEEKVEEDETTKTDFLILGSKSHKKKKEVKRVLPNWLANPEIICADLNSGPTLEEVSFLEPQLKEILRANGIDKLFPVQVSIMNWLSKCEEDRRKLGYWPRDVCVSAPTGSGKTLAYVLPIIQQLQSRLVPKIRCLIVVPVQELALQIHKVVLTYTSHTNLKAGLITGASSFEQEQNNLIRKTISDEYVSSVDILIATPGRLVDHILKTPGFSLESLRYLVIDEADRATEWLQYIPELHLNALPLTLENLSSSPPFAQKLLFSATLTQDPQKLNQFRLFQPILFTSVIVDKDTDVNLDEEVGNFIGRYTSPEELKERAVECSPEFKPIALREILLRKKHFRKTLVFTNSTESAHRLSLLLRLLLSEKNIIVEGLSSRLIAKQREEILNKFALGEINVLVSSDALARGMDIPNLQLVVSYDLPKHIKGYINRAGRTGRAGKSGTAISILTSNQIGIFKHMLSSAHKPLPKITKMELNDIADEINYEDHLNKLKDLLEEEKVITVTKKKSKKRKYSQISDGKNNK
ncbi:PREDICTED: probable ATP-dependent RNA helicase Dbp73D [Polistes dominula]|uniref:ATP-dependent RNA helicase n=1 Tax=Polistes dominula TaxID=743375 RepID=A0ABM1I6C7_POLDO|nr:PREDICTED: probable ATP-dependent RNA helicase Dbp73D [Polistes dominula]